MGGAGESARGRSKLLLLAKLPRRLPQRSGKGGDAWLLLPTTSGWVIPLGTGPVSPGLPSHNSCLHSVPGMGSHTLTSEQRESAPIGDEHKFFLTRKVVFWVFV